MINRTIEKFTTNAGMIATIGMMREAIYRLFGQNRPCALLGKSFRSPSLAILLERILKPEIQSQSPAR